MAIDWRTAFAKEDLAYAAAKKLLNATSQDEKQDVECHIEGIEENRNGLAVAKADRDNGLPVTESDFIIMNSCFSSMYEHYLGLLHKAGPLRHPGLYGELAYAVLVGLSEAMEKTYGNI